MLRLTNFQRSMLGLSTILIIGLALCGPACNTSATPSSDDIDLGDASLSMPESGSTLLAVQEEGAIGSATYYTDGDAADDNATVSRFEVVTDDGVFEVSVNTAGLPVEVEYGSLVIEFVTNADGTIDYTCLLDGEVVFSSEGIVLEDSAESLTARSAKGYTTEDVASCTESMVQTLSSEGNVYGNARDCVLRTPAMIKTAAMMCVIKDVLLARFADTEQDRLCRVSCLGAIFEEECMTRCKTRLNSGLWTVAGHYDYLWNAGIDMARQIRNQYQSMGHCPEDDNTNANDNTNDNANANANGNVNDNANANDNDNSNDNDNANDNGNDNSVDSRDPDGDGNFEAFACDASGAVEVVPGEVVISGVEDENCIADAMFVNMTTDNVVVYNYREWENTERDNEGWWTSSVPGAGSTSSVVPPYAAQNISGGRRDVAFIRAIIVVRADGDYAAGCGWIGAALREDDTQSSLLPLTRTGLESVRPCE